MIRQWEICHYPSERDASRHRISLWAEGGDVARVRALFPGRVGAVWVPHRKPYNAAFFVYGLSPQEKEKTEAMLSGQTPLPANPKPFLPVKAMDGKLTKEDTQEVALADDAVRADPKAVSTGVAGPRKGESVIRLGYFVPAHMPDAAERVQEILERTVHEKKVRVSFEKVFSETYTSLSLAEIHRLLKICQEQAVNRVVAVGEGGNLQTLQRVAAGGSVFVRLLPESVLDRNLWLTMAAELISYE